MAAASHPRPITHVIFDLDGLILDTESLCVEVARQVVARYGKPLTLEAQRAALGKRPLDCWAGVGQMLDIPATPQQLLDESEPLLEARWADVPLLPGALRLLRHLAAHGVPFALATSTPRATFDKKMASKRELRELLSTHAVVCGDEVACGKPAPDSFVAAAAALGADPADCLVLEDAPSGVQGASSAGMRVVVVPSLVGCEEYPPADPGAASGVVAVLPSLLAFHPADFGLPPFGDLLHGAVPMDVPIRIRGTVVKGFGRGSKELGIPTANIDRQALASTLSQAVTGIYAGWARLDGSGPVHPMVMSVGFNPFYSNKEKTAEPWLLAEFKEPFYGAELALLACAYIRPEANFTSLEALVARIHEDARVARTLLLGEPAMAAHAHDPFLLQQQQPKQDSRSGGDCSGIE